MGNEISAAGNCCTTDGSSSNLFQQNELQVRGNKRRRAPALQSFDLHLGQHQNNVITTFRNAHSFHFRSDVFARRHADPTEFAAQYSVGKELGRGSFGIVREARHKHFRDFRVAVKTWNESSTQRGRENFLTERAALAQLDHPHIVRLWEVHDAEQKLLRDEQECCMGLVSELCQGGELYSYIASHAVRNRFLEEGEVCAFLHQMSLALNYLHVRAKMIHRDVKTENWLFLEPVNDSISGQSQPAPGDTGGPVSSTTFRAPSTTGGRGSRSRTNSSRVGSYSSAAPGTQGRVMKSKKLLKLCDFGTATPIDASTGQARVGTLSYTAPEIYNGERATCASDAWSLGVCLFVMLSGQSPFRGGAGGGGGNSSTATGGGASKPTPRGGPGGSAIVSDPNFHSHSKTTVVTFSPRGGRRSGSDSAAAGGRDGREEPQIAVSDHQPVKMTPRGNAIVNTTSILGGTGGVSEVEAPPAPATTSAAGAAPMSSSTARGPREARETIQRVKAGEYDTHKLDHVSSNARRLVNQLLQVDQARRFTPQHVLSDPWLAGVQAQYGRWRDYPASRGGSNGTNLQSSTGTTMLTTASAGGGINPDGQKPSISAASSPPCSSTTSGTDEEATTGTFFGDSSTSRDSQLERRGPQNYLVLVEQGEQEALNHLGIPLKAYSSQPTSTSAPHNFSAQHLPGSNTSSTLPRRDGRSRSKNAVSGRWGAVATTTTTQSAAFDGETTTSHDRDDLSGRSAGLPPDGDGSSSSAQKCNRQQRSFVRQARKHLAQFLRLVIAFGQCDSLQRMALHACAKAVADSADRTLTHPVLPWYDLFVFFDADQDGELGLDELVEGIVQLLMRDDIPDPESVGGTSLPEYALSTSSILANLHDQLRGIVAMLDTRGSGRVSWSEWMALERMTQRAPALLASSEPAFYSLQAVFTSQRSLMDAVLLRSPADAEAVCAVMDRLQIIPKVLEEVFSPRRGDSPMDVSVLLVNLDQQNAVDAQHEPAFNKASGSFFPTSSPHGSAQEGALPAVEGGGATVGRMSEARSSDPQRAIPEIDDMIEESDVVLPLYLQTQSSSTTASVARRQSKSSLRDKVKTSTVGNLLPPAEVPSSTTATSCGSLEVFPSFCGTSIGGPSSTEQEHNFYRPDLPLRKHGLFADRGEPFGWRHFVKLLDFTGVQAPAIYTSDLFPPPGPKL
ncbi:unnamed protein product [Amoebophrya sp. A120]|nr:unnamed protein product [Amoebophrya sp. A120]|eukprot:GSA120T00011236001.1